MKAYIDYHDSDELFFTNADTQERVHSRDLRKEIVKVGKREVIAVQMGRHGRNYEEHVLIPGYVISIDKRENEIIYKVETVDRKHREQVEIAVIAADFRAPFTFW